MRNCPKCDGKWSLTHVENDTRYYGHFCVEIGRYSFWNEREEIEVSMAQLHQPSLFGLMDK